MKEKRTTQRRPWWQYGAAVVVATSLASCSLQALSETAPTSKEVLNEAWTYINNDYVDGTFNGQDWRKVREEYLAKPVTAPEEVNELVRDMLKLLGDPYTRFLSVKQFKSLQTTTTGELSGIGVQISVDTKTEVPIVIAAVEGSPAFRGGIKARDLIIAIDKKPTKAVPLDDIADRLRGAIGSEVKLTIRRGERTFDVSLRRETIEVNPVVAELKVVSGQRVGYVRLNQFNGNASVQMKQAIERLESQGATGYILDLRNNPGGLLEAGVEISRYWLKPGETVVYTVNRQGQRDEARAQRAPLTEKPLVVLIDGGSASASEILAGALKDNDRATLVGQKSFGKGLIQAIHPLKGGSGLVVSIARYQTPDRHDIHKQGIKPDIAVAAPKNFSLEQLATAADTQYNEAVKVLARTVTTADSTR